MSYFIPGPDDEFNTFVTETFGPYATANATALGLSTAQVSALSNGLIQWGYAWPGFTNAATAFKSATTEKDDKRALLEAAMQDINGTVQANSSVTDTQRTDLGVNVRKTTRTPAPVPTTTPSIQRIDTSTRSILRLFIVDATTPDSRAKPAGVQGCEIREQIGGTAPTDPATMAFLAIETRMPYRADFEATDVGKTVYFAMRWVNTRGEPGPWSQVYNAVVPS